MAGNRFNSVLLNGTLSFERNTVVRCGSTNFYFSEIIYLLLLFIFNFAKLWFWRLEGVHIVAELVVLALLIL